MGERAGYASLASVERAFAILGLLADAPATATEIQRALGLSWTTTHRALRNLVTLGALDTDSSGAYRVGAALFALGQSYLRSNELTRVGAVTLRALAHSQQASVQLNQRIALETAVLSTVDPRLELIPKTTSEHWFPLNAGSNGHVLLAFSGPAVFNRLVDAGLAAVTERTITEPRRLAEIVASVRERGYAVTAGDIVIGTGSASAPVFSGDGQLAGAVCAIVSQAQLEDTQNQLIAAVLESAGQISGALGFRPLARAA